MTNFLILIFHFERDRHGTSTNARQSLRLYRFHDYINAITNEHGFNELPFRYFAERDNRAIQYSCLPCEARSNGQTQQSMRDLFAELGRPAEFRVGVDAIVITRKLCKRHNIVLRNGPFFRDDLLPNVEFFKVESHISLLVF